MLITVQRVEAIRNDKHNSICNCLLRSVELRDLQSGWRLVNRNRTRARQLTQQRDRDTTRSRSYVANQRIIAAGSLQARLRRVILFPVVESKRQA